MDKNKFKNKINAKKKNFLDQNAKFKSKESKDKFKGLYEKAEKYNEWIFLYFHTYLKPFCDEYVELAKKHNDFSTVNKDKAILRVKIEEIKTKIVNTFTKYNIMKVICFIKCIP